MKTETINIYQFDELTENAQEKALQIMTIREAEDWEPGYCLDDWEEKLKALGFEDVQIYYDLSYCQGSGACFTATVNIAEYCKAHKVANRFRKLLNALDRDEVTTHSGGLTVYKNTTHYSHERSVTVGDNLYSSTNDNIIDGQITELVTMLESEVIKLGQEIYSDFQEDYEDYTSRDSVRETIRANEYEFLEDGRPSWVLSL